VNNHLSIDVVRAVFDEVCKPVALTDTCTRTRVASALLGCVASGEASVDSLKTAGTRAMLPTPTMWR
jgi:hypothetical protein